MPRILGRRLSRWMGRGIVGSLVAVGACERSYPITGVAEAPVQLRITAVTAGTPISTLVVAVTASDIPTALVFNLSVVNGVASGTIKIPPGPARTIAVTAVDAQGNVTHDGSVTIDVKPGQNPPVQIKLRPRSGQIPITVTFGNFGVVVTPATATIDASVTKQLQLTVIVTDVDGKQIAAPQVGWATTQPAIATVDGTGLVIGIANGTATIVATYEGVAGLSLVNVTGIGTPPQPQPLRATDYYVAFPPNIDLSQSATLSLSIAGGPAVKGTVTIPGLGFATTFATDATGLAIVPLPNNAALDAWDAVEPRGVMVHSEDSVAVLAISDHADGSMAPTEVPPAQALGSSYYVMSAGAGSLEGSLLAIVGTADVTKVTISPAVASGGHPAISPFQIALNRGDAYQLEASGVSGDLTGTLVQSDRPIGVFGGHMVGRIPASACCAGMLWTAIPPAPAVTGTHFFAVPFAQRNGYWLRVLALQSGTLLTTSGIAGLSTSMVAGQFTEARTTTGVEITSNLPILVAQFAEGNEGDAVQPGDRNSIPNPGVDPCFTLLHPVPAAAREYVFSTPDDLVFDRFVNIVAPFPAAVGNIALNGNPIDPSKFTQISLTYGAAVVPLEPGVNRLTSNVVAFAPMAYGWNDQLVEPNGFCFSPGTAY